MAFNRRAEVLELERLQEEVREQRNPGWRQQLRMHREVLGLDPETGKAFYVEQKLALEEGAEQGS